MVRSSFMSPGVALVILLLCGGSAHTQPSDTSASTRVDSIVAAHMTERGIVGASVVVMRGDRVIKRAGYGLANRETGERVSPATAFFVASVTKVFTAAAVMSLVDDGKFSLADSIGALIPDLPASWRPITVRQLLTFVSGLTDARMPPGIYPATYDAMLDSVRHAALASPPGAQYRYVQTNYYLLGRLIERQAGRPFDEFVAARLLRPYGLTSVAFGDHSRIAPGRAAWYTVIKVDSNFSVTDGELRPLRTDYPSFAWPTAGMHISAEDLARWVALFARGKVISPASVDTVWSATTLSDGSRTDGGAGNWSVTTGRLGRIAISTGGARAAVAHLRDHNLTIAVLTNTQGAQERRLILALARAYVSGD